MAQFGGLMSTQGNKSILTSSGIPEFQITESDWWDEDDMSFSIPDSTSNPVGTFRIVCTPAQHNSGR